MAALNLSLLSRGVGEIQKNGSEKVEVKLEPEDYFNLVDNPRRVFLPPIMTTKVAFEDGPRRSPRQTRPVHLPKTFITRKGALLLFSENMAQRQTKNKHDRIGSKMAASLDDLDLNTVEDFAKKILSYGSHSSDDSDRVYLKFVYDRHRERYKFIRPGYSPKRYLASWSKSFDVNFLSKLTDKGYITEKSLQQSNLLIPHLKSRINEDMSLYPAPYRIMRHMLMSPGSLSGYTFFWARPSSEDSAMSDDLKKGDGVDRQSSWNIQDGSIKVLQQDTSGKFQEVLYGELDKETQQNVLTELLVKSAISHALMKQQEVLEEIERQSQLSESLDGGDSGISAAEKQPDFDMVEAVASLLNTGAGDAAVQKEKRKSKKFDARSIPDSSTNQARGSQYAGSFKGKALRGSMSSDKKSVYSMSPRGSYGNLADLPTPETRSTATFPPVQAAHLTTIQDVDGKKASSVPVLPPIDGMSSLAPPIQIEPPTPQATTLMGIQGPSRAEEELSVTGTEVSEPAWSEVEERRKRLKESKNGSTQSIGSDLGGLSVAGSGVHSSSESLSAPSSVKSFQLHLDDGLRTTRSRTSQKGQTSRPRSRSKSTSPARTEASSHKGSVVMGPDGDLISIGGAAQLSERESARDGSASDVESQGASLSVKEPETSEKRAKRSVLPYLETIPQEPTQLSIDLHSQSYQVPPTTPTEASPSPQPDDLDLPQGYNTTLNQGQPMTLTPSPKPSSHTTPSRPPSEYPSQLSGSYSVLPGITVTPSGQSQTKDSEVSMNSHQVLPPIGTVENENDIGGSMETLDVEEVQLNIVDDISRKSSAKSAASSNSKSPSSKSDTQTPTFPINVHVEYLKPWRSYSAKVTQPLLSGRHRQRSISLGNVAPVDSPSSKKRHLSSGSKTSRSKSVNTPPKSSSLKVKQSRSARSQLRSARTQMSRSQSLSSRGSESHKSLEEEVLSQLAEHASKIAAGVLAHGTAGLDLAKDAKDAALMWVDRYGMHPQDLSQEEVDDREALKELVNSRRPSQGEPSMEEYKDLLKRTLSNIVSSTSGSSVTIPPDAEVDDDLVKALLNESLAPEDIEVYTDENGRSIIRSRSQVLRAAGDEDATAATTQSMEELDVVDTVQMPGDEDAGSEQGAAMSVSIRSKKSAPPVDEQAEPPGVDEVKRETSGGSEGSRSSLGAESDGSKTKSLKRKSSEKSDEKPEFVVGRVKDERELTSLYGPYEQTKREGSTVKVTSPPKETEDIPKLPDTVKIKQKAKPPKPAVPKAKAAKPKKEAKKKAAKKPKKAPSPKVPTPPPPKIPTPEPPREPTPSPPVTPISSYRTPSAKSEESMEFIIIRDEFSDDDEKKSDGVSTIGKTETEDFSDSLSPTVTEEQSESDESREEKDESQLLRQMNNKALRAAKRNAQAEKRRLEVERRRREREEQIRREKAEKERQEKLQLELEEDRRRREEERRLAKQRQAEERDREEAQRLAEERRRQRELEREAKLLEEHRRRMEELKRKQMEEERIRQELQRQRELEEAERRRQEEAMLATMAEEERLEYLKRKAEEEERRRIEEEIERQRREEEQRIQMEEARRLAEEMERKKKELERRLKFARGLFMEAKGLDHTQDINRAFVWSYYELLQWLGLDLPL